MASPEALEAALNIQFDQDGVDVSASVQQILVTPEYEANEAKSVTGVVVGVVAAMIFLCVVVGVLLLVGPYPCPYPQPYPAPTPTPTPTPYP